MVSLQKLNDYLSDCFMWSFNKSSIGFNKVIIPRLNKIWKWYDQQKFLHVILFWAITLLWYMDLPSLQDDFIGYICGIFMITMCIIMSVLGTIYYLKDRFNLRQR